MNINIFFIAQNICLCYNCFGDCMKLLKIQKLKNNKYKLIIDGESITTFDDVILKYNLLCKKEIDNEIYNSILKDSEYYSIYNRALKYILKRRRSEKQIKEYLIKLGACLEDAQSIIFKLKNNNLINDVEYCRAYIYDSIHLSKKGIKRIKNDLIIQDISLNIIEEELNKIDIDDINNKLEKIIIKKIRSNKKNSNFILKQKILYDMTELGYDKNMIIEILDKNLNNDVDILKSELEKIYIKLSKRYSGYDLVNNVKNKLLSKGFHINQINELLKEKTED